MPNNQRLVIREGADATAVTLFRDLITAFAGDQPEPTAGDRDRYDALVGGAPPMRALYKLLDRVARSESTILIGGENGTGKELVARAIHRHSPRCDRAFVVTNCSAFNDALLDSEMFGHKRGAFTGAVADTSGLFETADGGTFFLDEIADMSPMLQVKLLRVLQEGTFNRVGDTETRRVDVRIIAATNRDLAQMVANGTFREDLYYRINVIQVTMPALRNRREDLSMLIDHFLTKHQGNGPRKRLTPSCMETLATYSWPGNVRELENEIERLVVLAGDEDEIAPELLSQRIRAPRPALVDEPPPASLPQAIEALERQMIREALSRHGGNKTKAAAELNVSRRNLIRLVHKYRLE